MHAGVAARAHDRKKLERSRRYIASLVDNYIRHEVRVIEAVARRIGEPVHLVGHSFGWTVALATALSANIDVLSLTTFEANPLLLIKERGHQEMYR